MLSRLMPDPAVPGEPRQLIPGDRGHGQLVDTLKSLGGHIDRQAIPGCLCVLSSGLVGDGVGCGCRKLGRGR